MIELMGGELWDGKFEWAFKGTHQGERGFMMVDAIGLDEIRVTYQQQTLSKEFLRNYYRGSAWEKALCEAKVIANTEGGDFHEICATRLKQSPEKLSLNAKLAAEMMYPSFANDLHRLLKGKLLFDSTYNLAHWAKEFI
jgi:phosphoribosylaminoimidazole-succinocarboxamide synthase